MGLSKVLWGSNMSPLGSDMHALQMTSPNNLSKPNNKLEKLDKIFHTKTRQELAPFIHCVIESSKNQQQQPPVRALRSNYVRNFHILSENYVAIMSPKIHSTQTIWLKCYKRLARHHFFTISNQKKTFVDVFIHYCQEYFFTGIVRLVRFFWSPANCTIGKTTLIRHWFSTKITIWDIWIFKVPFLTHFHYWNLTRFFLFWTEFSETKLKWKSNNKLKRIIIFWKKIF